MYRALPRRRLSLRLLATCIVLVVGALSMVVRVSASARAPPVLVQCSLELFQQDVRNSLELHDMLTRELRGADTDPDHSARLEQHRIGVEKTLAFYETQLRETLLLLEGDL
jgi:hypothetical protein